MKMCNQALMGSEAQRNRKHGVIAGAPNADVIAAQR